MLTRRNGCRFGSLVRRIARCDWPRLIRAVVAAGFFGSGLSASIEVSAHHPGDHGPVTVWPRIDVIGPIGNRLPPSYRRQMNRPTYLGGKIAHAIAPTSQEAMAWHRAEHRGWYDDNGVKGLMHGKHCPAQRKTLHYFYPKPWQVLPVGPRQAADATAEESLPSGDHVHVEPISTPGAGTDGPETFGDMLRQADEVELIPPGTPMDGR